MAQQSNKSLMAQARLTGNELIGVLTGMPSPDPAAYLGGIAPIDYAKNVAHAQQLKDWRTIVAWLREKVETAGAVSKAVDKTNGDKLLFAASWVQDIARQLEAQMQAEQEGK